MLNAKNQAEASSKGGEDIYLEQTKEFVFIQVRQQE